MNGKAWPERHFVKKHGKIIELTDAEYAERQKRIAKMRQQFASEYEADTKQAQDAIESKTDYYEKGLDRLGDYMRGEF